MLKTERPANSLVLEDDRHCFICGEENPIGLKLRFEFRGENIRAQFVPQKCHQGFRGLFHGGLMSALLDEMMVNLLWKTGRRAVSAELKVRLRQPAAIGKRITFNARIEGEKKNLVWTAAEARDEEGTLLAEATATCMRVSD